VVYGSLARFDSSTVSKVFEGGGGGVVLAVSFLAMF
jgi:hypothetical protein